MNKILFIAVVVAMMTMAGCGTTKHLVQNVDDANAMQMQCKSDSSASTKTIVDTTTIATGVTLYTEITFDPPAPDTTQPKITVDPDGGITVEGGNVKNVRQFATEHNVTNVGRTEAETDVNVARADSVAVTEEHHVAIDEQPAPDPHKWRYIWRIIATLVAVAILVLILVFRNKILGWLANFIGGIARIFK